MRRRGTARGTIPLAAVVFAFVATQAAFAAWTRTTTPNRAAARFGTWSSCTAGTVTLDAIADGSRNAPGDWHGTATTWEIGSFNSQQWRAFVRFDYAGAIPSGCAITSMTLRIRRTTGTFSTIGVYGLRVQAVAADWTESAGPAYGIATTGPVLTTSTCEGNCDMNLNVTGLPSSFGWRLANDVAPLGGSSWVSRENGSPTVRPKLIVSYA